MASNTAPGTSPSPENEFQSLKVKVIEFEQKETRKQTVSKMGAIIKTFKEEKVQNEEKERQLQEKIQQVQNEEKERQLQEKIQQIPNKKMASNDDHETSNDEAAIPPSPVNDLVSGLSNLSLSNEWSEDHPFADAPPPWEPRIEDVNESKTYPLGGNWMSNNSVNLKKIVKNLPAFLKQMQNTKENLEHPIQQTPSKGGKSAECQARGLTVDRPYQKADQKEYSVDVHGYMLNISIPTTNKTFLIDESNKVCIPKPELVSNGDKRWIFIPSYLRASCALFDWSQAGIDDENTIRIVVVRPDQYDDYIKYCGYLLPIVSLPKDEEGVGYARYWIQEIATEFGLPYIWMIDDSVKQFYEMHPTKQQRAFEQVFKAMERLVKEAKEKEYPLAAISPARFNGKNAGKNAFTYKPSHGAVYLNISAINKKGIKYRPQSKVFEDMLFGAECVYTGKLWVVRWNRVQLHDISWGKSGAAVLSSKQTDSKLKASKAKTN